MKYTPTYQDDFYRTNTNDPRFDPSWTKPVQEEKSVRSFGKKLFNWVWQAPAKSEEAQPMIWSSLHFKGLASLWQINPMGFLYRVMALLVIPTFWAIVFWLYVHYELEIKIPYVCYFASFMFVWTLHDSVMVISIRPKLRELVGLLCHQSAGYWLSFCAGCMFYIYYRNNPNGHNPVTKMEAFVVAGIFYCCVIGVVANQSGTSGLWRYLGQVVMIILTTVLALIGAFAVFYAASYPIWKCQVWALFWGGMLGFWIAVHLFYKSSVGEAGTRETAEPIVHA